MNWLRNRIRRWLGIESIAADATLARHSSQDALKLSVAAHQQNRVL